MEQNAIINPPKRLPFFIRLATWFAERKTKKEMLIPKLLAWYPKSAISSGVLETLVAHGDKDMPQRLLQLVRLQVSFNVGCSFCIEMNSNAHEKIGVTTLEIDALASGADTKSIRTLSDKEVAAVEYARVLTQNPVYINDELIEKIKLLFTEREIVVLVTTISQVNYWSRLIKGLGIPVACSINKK